MIGYASNEPSRQTFLEMANRKGHLRSSERVTSLEA
jgi:hypothetical protein